jgi:hypothetical protein
MSDRVLAAFTMVEMERLQGGSVASFKRGQDKKKRRKRGLGIAAAVGAGVAGVGATGAAAARYGGGRAAGMYKTLRKEGLDKGTSAKLALASGGDAAKRQLGKDVASAKNFAGRVGNSIKGAGGAVKRGLTTSTGTGGTNAGILREAANRLGNAGKGAVSTKAGKIGVGLAGAAALGGAGALGYRALQGRKKNKKGK